MGWCVDLGMRRYITLLLFIGLAWGQSTTIAVFDFENIGLEKSDVELLSDRLQSELVKIGGYRFVERKKIDNILNEQKFHISGIVDEKYLIEIGKILGAELIVIGNVGKLENIYTISARLVNSESSEILQSANYDTGTSIGNLLTIGMANIASQLIGVKNSKFKKSNEYAQKLKSKNTLTVNIENRNIRIVNVKKKISNDGSNKVYVTYQQKISYKPSEIMIDWLDTDGIVFDGDKKYTKSKVRKDEIRSVSFYIPEDVFDYKVWLKH